MGLGIGGVVFFTPLRYQDSLGLSPQAVALPLVLVAVALIATAPLIPRVLRRLGPVWTVAGGLVLVAAGLVELAVDHLTGLGPRLPGLLVLGVGSACTTPLTALALDRADTEIAGVLTASRELAGALDIALFGLVVSLTTADGYRTGLLRPHCCSSRAPASRSSRHAPRSPTSVALSPLIPHRNADHIEEP